MEYGDNDTLATEQHIEDWVMDKCNTGVTTTNPTTQSVTKNTTGSGVVSGQHKTQTERVKEAELSALHYSRLWSPA